MVVERKERTGGYRLLIDFCQEIRRKVLASCATISITNSVMVDHVPCLSTTYVLQQTPENKEYK